MAQQQQASAQQLIAHQNHAAELHDDMFNAIMGRRGNRENAKKNDASDKGYTKCGGDHVAPECPEGQNNDASGKGCTKCGGDHFEPECPEGKDSDGGGRVSFEALVAALRCFAEAFKQEAQEDQFWRIIAKPN